jgi:uncharacterized protein (TIGR02118 family)
MVKLIALYAEPDDVANFDRHYIENHAPLVRKMPGLRKLEVSRIAGSPMGEPRYHLIAEMYFDDMDALNAAMKSPEGKAAGKDLMGFAGKVVHMLTGTVEA